MNHDMIDLSASRDPSDLIDAIYAARREQRLDLLSQLVLLLDHDEPMVREEVVGLIFTTWKRGELRSKAVEILETEYPVMVRRYDLWADSAGAGEFRGGIGHVREYELLTDCMLTARTSNHQFGAWGLFGGKGPPTSHTYIDRNDTGREELGPLAQREATLGSVLRLEQSGGAGYGSPLKRAVERVLEDVLNGYVSIEAAREDYGVVIDAKTLRVDVGKTGALRKSA